MGGKNSPEYQRAYYLANRERIRAQQREAYAASPEIRAKRNNLNKLWRASNPEKAMEIDRRHKNSKHSKDLAWARMLLIKYKITVSEYEAMFEKQGGVCAICKGPPRGSGAKSGRLVVDHCHTTNRFRGLLCGPCNSGIGHLQDSPSLLRSATQYLEGGLNGFVEHNDAPRHLGAHQIRPPASRKSGVWVD